MAIYSEILTKEVECEKSKEKSKRDKFFSNFF